MRFLKKILEIIKALINMPIYISNINKKNEELFRMENKLDIITQQLTELSKSNAFDGNIKFEEKFKNELSKLIPAVEQKLENQFLQIEALLSIYNSLPNLIFLPPTRGWAGSPDFLAKIIELILKEKPSFVLEMSSGVSTIIIGSALKLNNHGKVMSLDHQQLYANITLKNIELNNLVDVSDIVYSPLRNYNEINENWAWYETKNLNLTKKIDLLIIDGPPGSTQSLARYPAIPLLYKYFSDRTLILLDDTNRSDETIIVKKWIQFLNENNFRVSVSEFNNFEKGMVMLEVCRIVSSE